jgi:ATP-dependent Lon protease
VITQNKKYMKRKNDNMSKKRQFEYKQESDSQSESETESYSNNSSSEEEKILLKKPRKEEFNNVIDKIEKRIKREEKDKQFKIKFGELEKKIQTEINDRNIALNQIYELKLEMDDYIWFSRYIKIRDDMKDETEEKFNVTNLIYQKYQRLKDIDYHKMEKLKEEAVTEKCIVKRIINSDHNDYTKMILFKKYKLFCENNDSCSEEYSKCIEWIDTVLSLPTRIIEPSPIKSSEIGNKLKKLHNFLTNKIYGLNQVKEKILEAMCSKILNPGDTTGKILTLLGPPGVGKTSVASTIAEAMNLPFEQISFGSIQDSKILTGHSSTYIGALPGLFTKILIKAKRLDSLVLLDEIDKITNSADSNITSVLFHVLDKSQNNRFKDIYIPEIPLDLSQIIFLCAANNIEQIDPILRDRMTIINLPGYTIQDKINISEIYLIPKFKKELRFDENEIILSNKELEYLISKKTRDQPGMRDVERRLKELFDRLALLKHSKNISYSFDIKNIKFPVKITTDMIDVLLANN